MEHPEVESVPLVHETFLLSVARGSPWTKLPSVCIREDGGHRVLLPVTDPELGVDYYLTYLKSRRRELKPFCDWLKRA